MLHAATTALQPAADEWIIARGSLGSARRPAPHHHVYDGDQPAPHSNAWHEAMAEKEAATGSHGRETARQLLALFTIGCRTLNRFEEDRAPTSSVSASPSNSCPVPVN